MRHTHPNVTRDRVLRQTTKKAGGSLNACGELTAENRCVNCVIKLKNYRQKYVTSGVQHLKRYPVTEELQAIEKYLLLFS
jgi:hypothetical protein